LDWDRCADSSNPFISHAFLRTLEETGCTGDGSGWYPHHAIFRDASTQVIHACVPAYVKTHSYGEYVFDHGWARALEQAGGQYYPKLQICSPFSPVPGPRFLVAPDAPDELMVLTIANTIASAAVSLGLSSAHISFCDAALYEEILKSKDYMGRLGLQYHWHNDGFSEFDDFLVRLNSRKRKAIKRERRDAQDAGLEFVIKRGDQISAQEWAYFHRFYLSTIDRKWGSAYLTDQFFPNLSKNLGDQVVLMLALDRGTPVAGALNLVGGDTLYGRNWGSFSDAPFLHFELCYYQAIDFAISHGLRTVQAGAQGEHKIQRGYLPEKTYSAHFIGHTGLRRAVAEFLVAERAAIEAEITNLAEASPFRQETD